MTRIGRRFVPSSTIARRMNAQDDRRAAELRRRHPLDEDFCADAVAPGPGGAAPAGTNVPVVIEVALVPVENNNNHHPSVVDVQLVPVTHKRFPKPSRIARAIRQTDARTLDRRKLVAWAFAVKTRDQWKDRRTGERLLRTLNLDPRRAEAHHLVSRDVRAVRYDVRNGITLSMSTHAAVEAGELRIVGTAFFELGGVTYIDASAPVRFVRT